LVTGPQLLLGKVFALHLKLTRIGEARFGCNLLLSESLHQSCQQLMTEAPTQKLCCLVSLSWLED
jgi:hypothetical protein